MWGVFLTVVKNWQNFVRFVGFYRVVVKHKLPPSYQTKMYVFGDDILPNVWLYSQMGSLIILKISIHDQMTGIVIVIMFKCLLSKSVWM